MKSSFTNQIVNKKKTEEMKLVHSNGISKVPVYDMDQKFLNTRPPHDYSSSIMKIFQLSTKNMIEKVYGLQYVCSSDVNDVKCFHFDITFLSTSKRRYDDEVT